MMLWWNFCTKLSLLCTVTPLYFVCDSVCVCDCVCVCVCVCVCDMSDHRAVIRAGWWAEHWGVGLPAARDWNLWETPAGEGHEGAAGKDSLTHAHTHPYPHTHTCAYPHTQFLFVCLFFWSNTVISVGSGFEPTCHTWGKQRLTVSVKALSHRCTSVYTQSFTEANENGPNLLP